MDGGSLALPTVEGLGFRVWSVRLRVRALGAFKVQGLALSGLGFSGWRLGLRVWGWCLGLGVHSLRFRI